MNNLPTNHSLIAETENLFCYVIEGEIFYTYYKANSENSIEQVDFIINEYQKVTQGTPMKVLVEMGPYSSIDNQGRQHLENHKLDGLCEAIVIRSLAQRLIVGAYFKFKKHTYPAKVFKNRALALNWINQF